jgi:hypothetical protein
MFDDSPRDKVATLFQMEARAKDQTSFNQADAKAKMVGWVSHDTRYANVNPHRLVDYYFQQRACGAQVDLDDPKLTGRPRPEYLEKKPY